ncbi:MAG TPA: hypothetical protein VNG04_04005, partial [Candidatus Acidoferrum sp.]|nr:hypothetical protein [Candidatus Acidoferrum sp.]
EVLARHRHPRVPDVRRRQLHVEIAIARMRRKSNVEAIIHPPKVPYRETIKAAVEAHGRHKKQTGGHGQFGDCEVRFEPLPPGSDFQFENDIFGGSIPRQFVPAIEKGIQDSRMRGFLAGYPMVDFKATVFDGSYHAVDSSEMAFHVAGSMAVKDAMHKAQPYLLEPIMKVDVVMPEEYLGDVMGDLSSRRGHILGMEGRGTSQNVKANVPLSEMFGYATELRSMTSGRATYSMEFSHYAEMPGNLAEAVGRRTTSRS